MDNMYNIYISIYIIYIVIYIRIYPMFIEFNSCHGTPFWMAAAASSNGSGWVAWPFKAALHHQKWWISPWFSHGFMGWSWHQKWDGFSHCFMGCFSQSDQFFPSKSGCNLTLSKVRHVPGWGPWWGSRRSFPSSYGCATDWAEDSDLTLVENMVDFRLNFWGHCLGTKVVSLIIDVDSD